MIIWMKEVVDPTANTFLEWRMENYKFWLSQLPDLIDKAFLRFEDKSNIKLVDVKIEDSKSKAYHGFNPFNIKEVKVVTSVKDNVKEKTIYLPVPNKFDTFEVNSNLYIMIAEFLDYPVTVYDDAILIRYFRVTDGYFYFGREQKWPLVTVLHTLGLVSYDDFEETDTSIDYHSVLTQSGKFITYKQYKGTPFDKEILKSLTVIKSKKDIINKGLANQLNLYEMSTFFIRYLELFYNISFDSFKTVDVLSKLFKEVVIKEFNEKNGKHYTFTHLEQKCISYYDMVIDYFIKKGVDQVLQRKNVMQYNLDDKFILKWLVASNPRFQMVQSYENHLREINLKETILTLVGETPPPEFRDVDVTYMYNVDPINTPDNKKLGINQKLSKTVKLDEMGRFVDIHYR